MSAKKNLEYCAPNPISLWDKDCGRNVASALWYKLGLQYVGNQGAHINDHQLSFAKKRRPEMNDKAITNVHEET